MSGEDPEQFWTSADIAKELEVNVSVVSNWSYYGSSNVPPPAALTQAGMKLWTGEQAKQIIAGYWARKAEREQRKAVKERAVRMIEHLKGLT